MIKHKFLFVFSIPAFRATYKNMNKFTSKIFTHTRSAKIGAEEDPRI